MLLASAGRSAAVEVDGRGRASAPEPCFLEEFSNRAGRSRVMNPVLRRENPRIRAPRKPGPLPCRVHSPTGQNPSGEPLGRHPSDSPSSVQPSITHGESNSVLTGVSVSRKGTIRMQRLLAVPETGACNATPFCQRAMSRGPRVRQNTPF